MYNHWLMVHINKQGQSCYYDSNGVTCEFFALNCTGILGSKYTNLYWHIAIHRMINNAIKNKNYGPHVKDITLFLNYINSGI